ncbi:DUF2157 domain-containing protein [Synechocystis sp. PCC 7509]|uniref:DUF2157 domain-containing protein n=1 Tax=Synechocystis sp. PCC 7509 TaxID=927677 RepID=UPI0002ACFD2C|nr:DUF2157 domain-containing protein [Synechocystis sp. PCC 7509]
MITDKFRSQLRREAEVWRTEGLINDSQHEQLAQRYQFNAIDTSSRNLFVMVLIGLGSILIGLGIITFVAANWQDLSKIAKILLLLSLFVSVNTTGFYIWRKSHDSNQRLGTGLLLLGALILGANMALMGQIYQVNNPFYELMLAWGIGVLAMAYSLRLTSLSLLSILLIWIGQWGFAIDSLFNNSWLYQQLSWSSLLGEHMPILACVMFIPLAYLCKSRWVFAFSAIAIISALISNHYFYAYGIGRLFNLSNLQISGWAIALLFTLPPILLWSYDDFRENRAISKSFKAISQNLALIYLAGIFYSFSFYSLWNNWSRESSETDLEKVSLFPLINLLILIVIGVWQWLRLANRISRHRPMQSQDLTTIVIGLLIVIPVSISSWHTYVAPIPEFATFAFNALLFILSIGLMREGLTHGQRRAFWFGLLLLVLRILNWFFLANTGLFFKSLVFVLCGVGVIAIGLWFEKYVRTFGNTNN